MVRSFTNDMVTFESYQDVLTLLVHLGYLGYDSETREVFIPRQKYADKPAMLVELKWDRDADTALRQIREKRYPQSLKDWQGELLLVGLSYDKKTRQHSCLVEHN